MALCIYNGTVMEETDLRLDPADRGLSLGDGVFDTQLKQDGALPDAEAHFSRLLRHAETIAISSPWNVQRLLDLAGQLPETDCVIRTQLTRGPAARGLAIPAEARPTLLIRALPLPPPRPAPLLMISPIRRNETSPLSRIKATHYLDSILALKQAQDNGCNDAVFLNSRMNATCATAANLFIVKEGQWFTPPLRDGVMDGITRTRIIREKNAIEESITLGRLHAADEIWLTNSLFGAIKATGVR